MPSSRIVIVKPLHTLALPALLLAAVCSVAGCRDDRPAGAEGTAPAPAAPANDRGAPPPQSASAPTPAPDTGARLPDALRGVWYPDTDAGRADCQAYRALTPEQAKRDAGGTPLVGATVVLGRLVHQFAEYGEGNFYAPRDVHTLADGQWRLHSLLWLDERPAANAPADDSSQSSVDGLALRNERLYWYRDIPPTATSLTGEPDQPALFRCAAVRPEIYPVEPGLD